VWRGDFSADILRITQPVHLHLVDLWRYDPAFKPFDPDTGRPERVPTVEDVTARYRQEPRISIHQQPSSEFLDSLEPGALDWVYIDGDHSFAGALADLQAAWRVVKVGGVIVGDDYHWRDPDGSPSVKQAVRALCEEKGVTPRIFTGQFIIERITLDGNRSAPTSNTRR
jgi:hypothetical protein